MTEPATTGARAFAECTIAGWAIAGGTVLSAVVAINVWTVIAARVGIGFAGDFELTEIGVAVAAFMFLPYCQLTGRNVTAHIFTMHVRAQTRRRLDGLAAAVALVVAALLLWRMALGLQDQRDYALTSAILQIPVWWAYVPILLSLALLMLAAGLCLADTLRRDCGRHG